MPSKKKPRPDYWKPFMVDGKTPRCQSPKSNTGSKVQCERAASQGYSVCSKHGAGTKERPGGRPPIHGRFSKKLPASLIEQFKESVTDPKKLELDAEIALVTIRAEEMVATLSENRVHLNKIVKGYELLELALAKEDASLVSEGMKAMKTAINSASALRYTWSEILNLIQHRKSLVESQRKRLIENKAVLTIDQLMLLMTQIQHSILKNVDDPLTRSRIANDLKNILGNGGSEDLN